MPGTRRHRPGRSCPCSVPTAGRSTAAARAGGLHGRPELSPSRAQPQPIHTRPCSRRQRQVRQAERFDLLKAFRQGVHRRLKTAGSSGTPTRTSSRAPSRAGCHSRLRAAGARNVKSSAARGAGRHGGQDLIEGGDVATPSRTSGPATRVPRRSRAVALPGTYLPSWPRSRRRKVAPTGGR